MSEDNKKLRAYHKLVRQGFFTELLRCLDDSLEIMPDEAVDIVTYKALARKAESARAQEWFLDCYRYYITDKFHDKIMAKDTLFFTSNSDGLLKEHKGSRYGDEVIALVKKLKIKWQEGKIRPEHEEVVWSYMQRLDGLSIREKKCRDELRG